jgi:hypothetical protein
VNEIYYIDDTIENNEAEKTDGNIVENNKFHRFTKRHEIIKEGINQREDENV